MSSTLTGSDWAKQQTLDRIATATERSASSLASMLAGKAGGFQDLIDGAKAAGQTLIEGSEEEKQVANKLRKLRFEQQKQELAEAEKWAAGKIQRDKDDLRSQRRRTAERFNQFGARLTDGSSLLTHTTERIANSLNVIPVAGAVLGGMLGAVTGLISSVMKSKDTFIDMVDSGIMFGGSLTQFRIGLGNAGLSTEQFAAIVQQSGRGISVLGESRFLESTNRLKGFFDEFGLSINQGNEYFGEYIENARLSGSLYLRTMGEHEQSFKDNMTLMREQARLTGVSVRAQREQQQALRREVEYQVLLRSVRPERRAYIEGQVGAMTGVAGEQGAQFAREFFTFAETGAAREGGMIQSLMTFGGGDQIRALAGRARAGEQLNPDDLLRTIADLPASTFQTLLATTLGKRPEFARDIMAVRQTAEARFRPEGMAAAPTSTLTPETIALNAAQNRITELTAQFNAQITRLGELLIEFVTPTLTSLNNTLRAFTSAAPGTGITGGIAAMLRSISGPQTEGAEPSYLQRVAGAFDTGILAGLGSIVSEAWKDAWAALGRTLDEQWTSLMNQLREWRDQFITSLSNLIPSWMRESEGQRTANANARANIALMTPDEQDEARRMARNVTSGRVGLGTRYFTDALRNIMRIEESVERSGSLNTQQQQELQQQIANLQTIRTGLEGVANRSATEQELLQRILDAIEGGNRRIANAVTQQ